MEIRFWWHSSNEASSFDGVCGLVVGTLAYKLNTSDFDRSWMKGNQHQSPARGRVGICPKSSEGAVFSAIAWNVQGFHVAWSVKLSSCTSISATLVRHRTDVTSPALT